MIMETIITILREATVWDIISPILLVIGCGIFSIIAGRVIFMLMAKFAKSRNV